MASTDARPVPRKNAAFRYYFAIRKNDGTLITTWAGADSEVDKDGGGFNDCTNEATEIGTSGYGYIDLTSTEMNADAVGLKITVTNTDALPIVVTFFPEEVGDYRANVEQFGGSNGTFSGGRPEVNTTHWGGTAVASAVVKADLETIKTQTVTCAAGVTVLASVGTAATSTAQTGDSYAIVNDGTNGNAAIKTQVAAIETDTQDIQSRIPAALVNSRMDCTIDGTGMESGAVAAIRDEMDNNSAKLASILEDTAELQMDWVNGGRLDLIIDNVNTLVTGNDAYLSDLDSRIPAALTGDGNMKADALRINGQLTSAAATVTFPATLASTTNITAGTITTVTNLTNAPTSGDLTSTMKDSVETAVTTALGGTDVTDFTAIPSGTPNVLEALGFLYAQGFYRKEQTATTTTLFDGDNVAVAEATTSDDGTTFVRTKFTAP